ncbi:MAG: radical SAM protein [Candidatus Aenigmatarchaeota archaeon]
MEKDFFSAEKGIGFCPKCGKKITTTFLEKNKFFYIRRRCTKHIRKNEVINKTDKILSHYFWNSEINKVINGKRYWDGIRAVDVLITRKCNSDCKVCFAKYCEDYEEMSIENFKKILSLIKGAKVVLNGGEVTVRKDLKKFIKLTIKTGNFPVLYTNGLKLSKISFLKELKKAGLKEVVITFMGFREEIYERMRGGSHQLQLVLKALKNLEKENIKTSIYCVVAKGINEDQIAPILRYAALHKFIWSVNFKPIYLEGVSKNSKLSKENIISYSELVKLIGRVVNGVNDSYILSTQKLFYYIQNKLATKFPPIYFSWLEIPTIFVRRNNSNFKPLISKDLVNLLLPFFSNNYSDLIFKFLPSEKFIYSNSVDAYLLKIEDFLYRRGVRKIVLGLIAPYVSPYITSSPTLKQLNGKIVPSSLLAW